MASRADVEQAIEAIPRETAAASPRHSYRNYNPAEFQFILDALTEFNQQAQVELLSAVRGKLRFIESGRWFDVLETGSRFFNRLDADEKALYTRRNPDLVEWYSIRQRADDLKPVADEYLEIADGILTSTLRDNRVGQPERVYDRVPPDTYQPPLFERPIRRRDTNLKDMLHRRRSYRNWSPFEFHELFGERGDTIELSRGELRELNWSEILRDTTIRDVVPRGGTLTVERRTVVLQLLGRVEAGRFRAFLKELWTQFSALDPDESRLITLRNPGAVTWLGIAAKAYGWLWDLDRMFPHNTLEWPLLGETDAFRARINRRADELE